MVKKKIKKIIIEDNLLKTNNDIYKVYIYKRPSKLFLMPIPYKWKLDFKKIAEIKNPPNLVG
jgi:hypothetical protein